MAWWETMSRAEAADAGSTAWADHVRPVRVGGLEAVREAPPLVAADRVPGRRVGRMAAT